jgi:hypothetical protein
MPDARPIGASFRDPHGFVFTIDGVVHRQVAERHREHFDLLLSSGLYDRLVGDGLLIPHTDASLDLAMGPDAYRIIRPEQISFVSYPYEWGFEQLRDAARLTLTIQSIAMDHGMSLRDATSFNVTFHRGRPVFIDTTSFERLVPDRPWVAYRQFCEQFLAPLTLASATDARLNRLSVAYPDGIPLDMAARLLPRKVRRRPSVLTHIVMHGRSQVRHAADAAADGAGGGGGRRFSSNAFRGLVDNLTKAVDRLRPPTDAEAWTGYYDEASHYDAEAFAAKERLVDAALDRIGPSTVWDLGANTGLFARHATQRGIDTIAFDFDPSVVDAAYTAARAADDRHLLPLVMDLANPSPAIGWANEERDSLSQRGPADLVVALALMHHIVIGRNVPMDRFVAQLGAWGRSALVEWIPKSDEKVQTLLRAREDVFDRYDEDAFRRTLEDRFQIVSRDPISGTDRVLYLVAP